jgi:DnaJ-class molecular chaperone
MKPNPYEVLGVVETATHQELLRAYWQRTREHHPDHHEGSLEAHRRMQNVNAAFEAVRTPEARAQTDARLRASRPQPRPVAATPAPVVPTNGSNAVTEVIVSILDRHVDRTGAFLALGGIAVALGAAAIHDYKKQERQKAERQQAEQAALLEAQRQAKAAQARAARARKKKSTTSSMDAERKKKSPRAARAPL